LKPCPFCGKDPEITWKGTSDEKGKVFTDVKCVECPDCGIVIKFSDWNTRPITPKEEWISVEERLPKIGQIVDIWHSEWERITDLRFDKVGEKAHTFDNRKSALVWREYPLEGGKITHWRPEPSPPTKDQTEKEDK